MVSFLSFLQSVRPSLGNKELESFLGESRRFRLNVCGSETIGYDESQARPEADDGWGRRDVSFGFWILVFGFYDLDFDFWIWM